MCRFSDIAFLCLYKPGIKNPGRSIQQIVVGRIEIAISVTVLHSQIVRPYQIKVKERRVQAVCHIGIQIQNLLVIFLQCHACVGQRRHYKNQFTAVGLTPLYRQKLAALINRTSIIRKNSTQKT